jgi:hypothetical protein
MKTSTERILFAALTTATVTFFSAPARADLGGTVPSPGNCDYPAIGNWGLDGPGVYHWVCDFPVEVNGSHHHCQAGGAAANITAGVSLWIFNAGITTPTGIIPGICYWACPDLSVSAPPNPPGGWKNYIKPTECKSVAPNPLAPPAEPPADEGPPPLPPAPPLSGATPAVTDPGQGNPDATTNNNSGK